MEFKVIDTENKIVKVECRIEEYLNGSTEEYIKTAIRMKPKKIIIEINTTEE